jgi:hypothetical protein
MRSYQTNGVKDTITLPAGVFETRGSAAWWLAPGDSLVGAGMEQTTLRLVEAARFAVSRGY